jgi:archaellum component FlaG (FlaF/FlaG flagellin family)
MVRYLGLQGGSILSMIKGAITIFAFSIFFFSCATQVTTQPPPAPPKPVLFPDLTISDISLSETGKVEVMISNIGKGPVPYRTGSLVIYVDGHQEWRDSLGIIPDQTFLLPGGFVLFTTPVELVGRHEVRAVVDNEEKMVEENEGNNIFTKVLGKEKLEIKPLLPDLTITDLFLNPKRKLVVTIANIGDSPLPLGGGNLKIIVDGSLKGSYTLGSLSDQSSLPMKGSITLTTPLTLVGRHEIDAHVDFTSGMKESNEENNSLKKILDGAPFGPDIVVKDLDLTEDLELMIILSNGGEGDLRKGVTFRIRILVNGRKISEFDHFISEGLKANFGNRYLIDPPYGVGIAGISKVKVSISPKLPSDDIRLENNVLERTFIIFPFKVGPQGREEFSFSFSAPRPQGDGQTEKVKAEARWEGGSSSLMLSFKKSGTIKGIPTLSGKSPLKVEFPISFEEVQKESVWNVLITNLIDKKVEGHLIIQHP